MTIVDRNEERSVFAPITEAEARDMMLEITETIRRINLLEEEKREASKAYKDRIDEVKQRQLELLGVVSTKTREQRRVVRVTYDFASGIKYVWSPFSPDTVISTEKISDEERQKMIPQLAAGDPRAVSEEAEVQAEIFPTIASVQCRKCHRFVPKSDAYDEQVRDKKTGELLRTEFQCRDVAECAEAAGAIEVEEVEDLEGSAGTAHDLIDERG